MAEIETKVTADTSGAAAAMGNVAGATGKFTSEVKTARGALHEFHGISRLVESVMSGNLTGAVRGASIAMRSLSAAALNPLILGLAAAAAGIYAAARAWGAYFEQQEKAREVMHRMADELHNRSAELRPDLYDKAEGGRQDIRRMARAGDYSGMNERLQAAQEKRNAAVAASNAAENNPELRKKQKDAYREMMMNSHVDTGGLWDSFIGNLEAFSGGDLTPDYTSRNKEASEKWEKARGIRNAATASAGQNMDAAVKELQAIRSEIAKLSKHGMVD